MRPRYSPSFRRFVPLTPMPLHVSSIAQRLYRDLPNEDVAGHTAAGDTLSAWIFDGASTITKAPFITFPTITDSGWFSRSLADALASRENIRANVDMSTMAEILSNSREEYQRAGGLQLPTWAWPSAAAVIINIARTSTGARISILRYGDCCFEFAPSDGTVARRRDDSEPMDESLKERWKPYSGLRVSALHQIISRRSVRQQFITEGILTLNPASAYRASIEFLELPLGACILMCSDGLSRLWKSYNLMSSKAAIEIAKRNGLSALLRVLRNHELSSAINITEIKRSDDVSALLISL
jgi:hypothetical protein